MKGYALFDLDQTLVPWDMQLLYANWVFHHAPARRLYLLPFLLALPFAKILGARRLKRLFLGILCGMTEGELNEINNSFLDRYVTSEFYPETLALFNKHLNNGECVILTSASPCLYVEGIGERLGASKTFCTQVKREPIMPLVPEIKINNKSHDKITALKLWLAEEGLPNDLPLKHSITYTDSTADLPLIEAAEHAVLINPSDRLIQTTKEMREYEILTPSRPFNDKVEKLKYASLLLFGLYQIK